MKIAIANIQNQGDLGTEVTMLRVTDDCDLNNYIVTQAKASEDNPGASTFVNTFWFPPKPVKKGDFVLLFSRTGENGTKANELGSQTHIIHWQSDHAIWNETEDAVIVLELSSWSNEKTRSFVSFV